jgi:hypothetical protein
VPPPLKISVLSPGALEALVGAERRLEALQRLIQAVLEALDVLRAAVVADDAAQLQVRQRVTSCASATA